MSDGEIDEDNKQGRKQPNYRRKDREEGEEEEEDADEDESDEEKKRQERGLRFGGTSGEGEKKDESAAREKESKKESDEEEGEINDGEKPKRAFIPRVLCKYYQRGKCSWGRGCKFLHPGVNDTGKRALSLI